MAASPRRGPVRHLRRLAALGLAGSLCWWIGRRDDSEALLGAARRRWQGGRSVEHRLAEHGPAADARWAPHFATAGLHYPPAEVTLLALKDERRLEVHAREAASSAWHALRVLPIEGASGGPGPKLREGDRQVPEGIYRISLLNANSRYHLSLRLDYPNADDRRLAALEGRTALGGDVMIHGTSASVGCLAMGNRAAEDLFVLAARVGIERLRVIISPTDLRGAHAQAPIAEPPWTANLYAMLKSQMQDLRRA